MKTLLGVCCAVLTIGLATPGGVASAQQAQKPAGNESAVPSEGPNAVPKERTSVTHATVTIDGQKIPYTATAGTLLLYNADHEATASVFYIAYTEDGVDSGSRPVTFAYNGGPGGASALVDVGGFGPRRVDWPGVDDAEHETPPYRLENNQYSIMKSTDLVFIDAVGTGYSRIVGKGTPKMFYGISEDASAFAQFIQSWVTHYSRWNSPKFLLGESYGTTRNAVLAQDLVQQGVYLNGVIMCSTVLNFGTIVFGRGNDLPYALYLPSYAAEAWYHHRLGAQAGSLDDVIQKARDFAGGPYLTALFAGDKLSDAQRRQTASQLSALTGIPDSLWLASNLRMSLAVFRRKVMGSDNLMTGRYDSRFTLPELQPMLPTPGQGNAGPSTSAFMGALTATFDSYLADTLGFKSERPYAQTNFGVGGQWDFQFRAPLSELTGGGFVPNVAPSLARAMTNDPGMHVLFNNGYYDMATPFFGTEYTVAHMDLPAEARSRIRFAYYPVGHMLYVNPDAMPMLQKSIDDFITASTTRKGDK
jgi:carboxypeptidase C (cathepsin A)